MKAYVFQAALLCEFCAKGIKHEKHEYEGSEDSDHYPQGPFSDGGGEADSPQHCNECSLFLENSLTPDGAAYVREAAAKYEDPKAKAEGSESWEDVAQRAGEDGQGALAEWIMFYLAWG